MQIIQDLQNLYCAYVETRRKRKDFREFYDSIVQQCDKELVFENLYKYDTYYTGLRYAMAHDDFDRYCRLEKDNAVKCRASSCFFRLKDGKLIKQYKGTTIRPDKIFLCVNVMYRDRPSEEFRCDGCAHHEELIVYKEKEKQLKQAQKEQEIAKQKLLDNFRFWKQRV